MASRDLAVVLLADPLHAPNVVLAPVARRRILRAAAYPVSRMAGLLMTALTPEQPLAREGVAVLDVNRVQHIATGEDDRAFCGCECVAVDLHWAETTRMHCRECIAIVTEHFGQ